MNFMGIGLTEVLVVVLVAVIILGPTRAAEMARTAGRMMREVRRSFTDFSSDLEEGRWGDTPDWRSEPGASDSDSDRAAKR